MKQIWCCHTYLIVGGYLGLILANCKFSNFYFRNARTHQLHASNFIFAWHLRLTYILWFLRRQRCLSAYPRMHEIRATLMWHGFMVAVLPSGRISFSSGFNVTNSASIATKSPACGISFACNGLNITSPMLLGADAGAGASCTGFVISCNKGVIIIINSNWNSLFFCNYQQNNNNNKNKYTDFFHRLENKNKMAKYTCTLLVWMGYVGKIPLPYCSLAYHL